MSRYFARHYEAAVFALRRLFSQPVAALSVFLTLAVAMTLPMVLFLGVQNSRVLWEKANSVPTMTLYMDIGTDAAGNDTVRKALADDARIEKTEFVSKQEGLAQLQSGMGGEDPVALLDENPLPDAFVVTPKNTTPEGFSALQKELSALPGVESVKADAEWMQTLYRINLFVVQLLWFLSVTLALAFLLVTYNTIRLQVLGRRDEIGITRLLGAPASFIRRPFLYFAFWQSFFSVWVALGLCYLLGCRIRPLAEAVFAPYGLPVAWRFFSPAEAAAAVVLVCGMGVAAARLATRKGAGSNRL